MKAFSHWTDAGNMEWLVPQAAKDHANLIVSNTANTHPIPKVLQTIRQRFTAFSCHDFCKALSSLATAAAVSFSKLHSIDLHSLHEFKVLPCLALWILGFSITRTNPHQESQIAIIIHYLNSFRSFRSHSFQHTSVNPQPLLCSPALLPSAPFGRAYSPHSVMLKHFFWMASGNARRGIA